METHHIVCSCHSTEHLVEFAYVPGDEDEEIYVSVQLSAWKAWYKRVWPSIKYIFGYKCKYGHWDCTTMSPEEAKKLHEFLSRRVASQSTQS